MAEAISTEKTIEDEEVAGEKISHSTMAKGQLTEFNFRRDLTNQKPPIYRWLTDTGVGEISYLAGPFFRFFSAGQLYALIALALASAFLIKRTHQRRELLYLTAIVAINLTAVIIGFSRSLWLGLLATFAYLILNLPWKKTVRLILYSIGVASLAIILVGTLLPSVYDLMEKRVSSILHPAEEEASTNRFNLLEPVFEKVKEHPVLGSGFGTTVEYESVVPEKYGTLRVFAFEWSYLDTILEVGLLGLLIYLMLIFKVFKEGIKQQRQISGSDKIIIAGLLAALFGIVITNITTPYLNHPLGIGFLLLIITTLAIISKTQHASQSS